MGSLLQQNMYRRLFLIEFGLLAATCFISSKLKSMSNPKGITIRQSSFSVEDTINRVAFFLQQKGVKIYARIDQQIEVASIGQKIKPIEFIMFGNPMVGVQAMLANPLTALDLPLKILAWEREDGEVYIAYNDQTFLSERYDLNTEIGELLSLDALVNNVLLNQGPSATSR
jgi:uncharacterized protein (DUF302 family)